VCRSRGKLTGKTKETTLARVELLDRDARASVASREGRVNTPGLFAAVFSQGGPIRSENVSTRPGSSLGTVPNNLRVFSCENQNRPYGASFCPRVPFRVSMGEPSPRSGGGVGPRCRRVNSVHLLQKQCDLRDKNGFCLERIMKRPIRDVGALH
jgi:hypothetical protein